MFTPDNRTADYITEATMECGCQIIRESEVGEVQGITFCSVHAAAHDLLACLEMCVAAMKGDEPMMWASEIADADTAVKLAKAT